MKVNGLNKQTNEQQVQNGNVYQVINDVTVKVVHYLVPTLVSWGISEGLSCVMPQIFGAKKALGVVMKGFVHGMICSGGMAYLQNGKGENVCLASALIQGVTHYLRD